MKLNATWNVARKGWLPILARSGRAGRELYRVCFLARAGELGLLALLGQGRVGLSEMADRLGVAPERTVALKAFLDLGVVIGELSQSGDRYGLKGRLARALVREENDPWLALFKEVSELHAPCVLAAPGQAEDTARLSALTDSLATVIARSSRILEPIMLTVVNRLVPSRGPMRLLEIGCGSGVHVLAALRRNPELTATALERETEVAEDARARLERAGFADRVQVRAADVRSLSYGPEYDLITLYNNIYYFSEEERGPLLARLHSWLRPGGRLALTTPCPGGGTFSRFMMLWSTMTAGVGPLPEARDFVRTLGLAGFTSARARILLPGDSYTLFVAEKPSGVLD